MPPSADRLLWSHPSQDTDARAMSNVLTLITDPVRRLLSDIHVNKAVGYLEEVGAAVGAPDWLAPGIACDLPFDSADPAAAQKRLRDRFNGAPLDIAAQPAAGRRKRVLIADMDSTMITIETLDMLAALLGYADEVARITDKAMNGEIRFRDALRARLALLEGENASGIDDVNAAVDYTPGGQTLVQTMRANGAYCALVSGGFTFTADMVRDELGFDEARANRLIVENGRLAGRAAEPILGREAKLEALRELCARHDVSEAEALAVGDGANDLDMITAAGMGVAFRAKPVVAAEARFTVEYGDLTAVLYLQGYRQGQFVA